MNKSQSANTFSPLTIIKSRENFAIRGECRCAALWFILVCVCARHQSHSRQTKANAKSVYSSIFKMFIENTGNAIRIIIFARMMRRKAIYVLHGELSLMKY